MFNHDDQVTIKNILKKDWILEMRNDKNQKMKYEMKAGQSYALPGYMAQVVVKRILDRIYIDTNPKKMVREYPKEDEYFKQVVTKVVEVMSPMAAATDNQDVVHSLEAKRVAPTNDPTTGAAYGDAFDGAVNGAKGREEKELDQSAETLSADELDSAAPMTNPDGTPIQKEEEFADAEASQPENPAETTEPVV